MKGLVLLALVQFPVARWCVSEGSISASGRVSDPRMRAVLPGSDGNAAEVGFTWLGPSEVERPLASGLPRRQIGLKLRAADPCNLIYVMWRLHPEQRIVVSVKRNPGLHTSRECGNGGYRNLKPRLGLPPPPFSAGTNHVLSASISSRTLRVIADGALAWEGDLDDDTLTLAGPAGIRSDNGRFEVVVRASAGSALPPAAVTPCTGLVED